MKLSELKQQRAAILDQMEALTLKLIDEKRDFTEEEKGAYDVLDAQEKQLETQIKALETIQAKRAANAVSIATPIGGATRSEPAQPRTPAEKGKDIADMVRALYATKGQPQLASQYARETLKNESVARVLSAGVGADGGYLIAEETASDFIELVRPASVVYGSGARVVPMPGGNMTLNKQTAGSSASYIDENENAPVSSPTVGQVKLRNKKLAVLTPMSNDLLRQAGPQVGSLITSDLVRATAQRTDLAFLRGDGTAGTPKGMRYWANSSNVNAMNGTVNAANVEADVSQKLFGKILLADIDLNDLVTFMNPRVWTYMRYLRESAGGNFVFPEMQDGMLGPSKVKLSTQIPVTLGGGTESEIIVANMAHVIIGESLGVRIDVQDGGAYYDGSAVVSGFSKDQSVIRVLAEHDMGVRQDLALAVLTGVTWGA